jgi:large repetitive protein
VRERLSNRTLALTALVVCCGCERAGRPPSAVSITPESGSGIRQSFTLVYAAPNGFSDLTAVRVLFGTSTDAVDSCYIWYDPIHDALELADDDAAKWTDFRRRGAGSAENSQCRIDAAGSSVSGEGAKLTLTLTVTFKRAFAGRKNVYLSAEERQGLEAGLVRRGRWLVPYDEAGP